MKFTAHVPGNKFLLLAEVAKCLRLKPLVLGAKYTHWCARLNNFCFVFNSIPSYLDFHVA